MLNFNKLIKHIEDLYLEKLRDFVKGKITYDEYELLDKYNEVIMKLEYRKKIRKVL